MPQLTRRHLLGLAGLGLAGCAGAKSGSLAASPPPPTSVPTTGAAATTGPAAATTPAAPTPVASSSAPAYDLAALRRDVGTRLVLPADAAYADARRIENPAFDGATPKGVLRAQSSDDVVAGLKAARGAGVGVAVRSGGHSYGGWSTGPGLVVDLSPMAGATVSGSTLTVGAGTKLIDVYSALGESHALASGSCPTVGIGGITLGGGIGVLGRLHGLTCDALQSADVVLPDGTVTTASASSEPDLFWALRGGGAAPAVVLTMHFALQPATQLTTFSLSFAWTEAAAVAEAWDAWAPDADPRIWSTLLLLSDPTSPAPTVRVNGVLSGDPGDLDRLLVPLLQGAKPLTQGSTSPDPFGAMLTEAGCGTESVAACHPAPGEPGGTPAGTIHRDSFAATSSILAKPLGSKGAAAAVAIVAQRQDQGLGIGGLQFDALGGAIGKVPSAATAFPHRTARADVQHSADRHTGAAASVGAASLAWLPKSRAALAPYATGGAYVNYADPTLPGYGTAYWGANLPRLQAIAAHYDPDKLLAQGQCARLA